MATVPHPTPLEMLPAAVTRGLADALPVVARFVYDVFSLEKVQRIAFSADGLHVDLWVLMREEDLGEMKKVYRMEREHLSRLPSVPFDLHVVALTRTDPTNLPALQTILER